MSGDLIDTTEMYLKTVFELHETGTAPMRARIAERLGHSGPTVSQTVARMERDGLLHLDENRQIQLTDRGRELAMDVMRKHRLAERLLTDVIGLDWEFVHDEACRWEHVMSDRVEKRLVDLLDHPHFSPYGNPIPGLVELGEGAAAVGFLDGVVSLKAAVTAHPDESFEATVARLGEPLQTDIELLERLAGSGVVPGGQITVGRTESGIGISVTSEGADLVLDLPEEVSRHIFVSE